MKRRQWYAMALACIVFGLAACATHPPQEAVKGNELADSWESWYVDAWADNGV